MILHSSDPAAMVLIQALSPQSPQPLSIPSDSRHQLSPAWPYPETLVSSFRGSRLKFRLFSLALRTPWNGPSPPVQPYPSSLAFLLDLSLCLFPSSHSGSLTLPQTCFILSHIALFTVNCTPNQLLTTVYQVPSPGLSIQSLKVI